MFSSYENKCICWGTSTLRLHIKQHYVLEYWDSNVSWTLAWLTLFESSVSARRRLSQNQYNILTRRLRGNTLSKTINFHSFILTGLRSHPRVCVGEEIAWYMLRHKFYSVALLNLRAGCLGGFCKTSSTYSPLVLAAYSRDCFWGLRHRLLGDDSRRSDCEKEN